MSLREETIGLSHLYGVKPTRNRGQNFLIDEKIYDDIISAAAITKDETVLEVGPGLGFLTARLAAQTKKVIAVELDTKLFEALHNRLELKEIQNVTIYNNDIMNFTAEWTKEVVTIPKNKLVVVANLPYTISSIFLRHFVGGNNSEIRPSRFILMLQKEVAERISAPAGKMSILAVSVQLYADPKIVEVVSRQKFWPVPEVDSAIISITRNDQWLKELRRIKHSDEDLLRLVRIGFSARRKMLKANIAAGYRESSAIIAERLQRAGISETARAQELGLKDWIRLLSFFS